MLDLVLVTFHTFCISMPLLKNVLLLLKHTVDLQCIPIFLFATFVNVLKFVEETKQCTVMEDMGS